MKKNVLLLFVSLVIIGCFAGGGKLGWGASYDVKIMTTPPTEGVEIYVNDKLVGKTDALGQFKVEDSKGGTFDVLTVVAKYKNFEGTFQTQYKETKSLSNVLRHVREGGLRFAVEFGYINK